MKKIFNLLFITICATFLLTNIGYAENTYNDACGIENTGTGNTDLYYAKLNNTYTAKVGYNPIDNTYFLNTIDSSTGAIYKENINFSFKNVGGELIGDINSEIYNLDFLYKTGSVLYFKDHGNNNKVYTIDIGNKQDFSLKLFNNLNNFLYLFSEGGYIYYKNPSDSYKIYKIKETCTNPDLRGYKITGTTQSNYVFENGNYIYYRNTNISNKLYKIKKDGTDLNNTGEKVSDAAIYNMKVDNISSSDYHYLFNDNDWVYLKDIDNKIYRLDLNFVPSGIIQDNLPAERNDPELILDNINDNIDFLIADNNYIYYKKDIDNNTGPIINGPTIESYTEEIYRIKKDGTNNELIYQRSNTSNSFNGEFIKQDINYLYLQYGYFNMHTYKLKKDGTEFSKLFDINFPHSYLLDNGELYYFDENHINSFFRYRVDGTNDFYLKNDNTFNSNKILISTGITDINITLDTTLENNTSYNFYIANNNIEKTLFVYDDNLFLKDGIIETSEGIYFGNVENDFFNGSGELYDIYKDITIGDYIIFENEGLRIYFPVIKKDGFFITIGEPTEDSDLILDPNGGNILVSIKDYKQIDNSKLDGNSAINITNTLGKNNGELYYKVELFSDDLKTSPVVNSVEISEYKLNKPENLKQYIKSPLLEKEGVYLGMKIGKFQSGSGVILEADILNNNINQKIVFNVYSSGTTIPLITKETGFITGGTTGIILPYIGPGDYYWEAYTEDINGNKSEIVGFGGNSKLETDYSLFEGFEPYPYGYKFINNNPDYRLLTGSIIENNGIREIENGSKWEILDLIFPLSLFNNNLNKYIDAFEMIGLNNEKPHIFAGNCFGLSLTSVTQFLNLPYVKNNFPEFSKLIGNGYIWDKINIESSTDNSNWVGYNDIIKTILANQLFQYESNYSNLENESYTNMKPIDILNTIKDNPEKNYILTFKGKDNCLFLDFLCTSNPGHAVVPYKVEGNKIYIWDNNFPYPFLETKNGKFYSYNRYIEINFKNNTYIANGYDRDIFKKIGIVEVNNALYDNNLSLPGGFNEKDTMYTISGLVDFIIKDSYGNKSGFINGNIINEIAGVNVLSNLNITNSNLNGFNKIYLPNKLDGLSIEIKGNTKESYDLMIAGGDYYTKISNVETSTGEIDIYNITRENIQIDFDDNKIGKYNLLVDNFQNNGTGTVYIQDIESNIGLQEYNINWSKVIENKDDSVIYKLDTNNDGTLDKEKELKPITINEIEKNSAKISGYIYFDRNKNGKKDKRDKVLRNFKVYLDLNNDGKLQKKTEPYTKTNSKGYYEFKNLKTGEYKVILGNRGMKFIKRFSKIIDLSPKEGYYDIDLKNGEEVENKDFTIKLKSFKRKHKNHRKYK